MSLRARLVAAVVVASLVALVAAGSVTYSALSSFLYQQVDGSLTTASSPLGSAFASAVTTGQPISTTFVASHAPGMFVELRSASNRPLAEFVAYRPGGQIVTPALPPHLPVPGSAGAATYLNEPSAQGGGPGFRVRVGNLGNGLVLVLALPLTQESSTLSRLLAVELIVALAALIAAGLIGWWLVRVGLQPLQRVEATAGAIAAGQLDQRVPEGSPRSEVGRLARSFNTMLDRIQHAFTLRDATEQALRSSESQLRQFVADASHELRTPVAAVGAYTELAERATTEHPEDLPRILTGIRAETSRMGQLVQDLLLLARLDEGRPLEHVPIELVGLAATAVQAAQAVGGDSWPVALVAEHPVEIVGDPDRLRQVLDNLLANVRAHTPAGTHTIVYVGQEGPEAVLSVTDDGPGLSPEHAAHVFERFYRADSSRSRASGGAGLGLALVAAILTAHGGSVALHSTPGEGATFIVRLPIEEGLAPSDDQAAIAQEPEPGEGRAAPAGGAGVPGRPAPPAASPANLRSR